MTHTLLKHKHAFKYYHYKFNNNKKLFIKLLIKLYILLIIIKFK